MEIYNYSYKVSQEWYWSIETKEKWTQYEHIRWTYTFYFGVVDIYAEPTVYTLSFAYNWRLHCQTVSNIKKPKTERWMVIMAWKFWRNIVKQNTSN